MKKLILLALLAQCLYACRSSNEGTPATYTSVIVTGKKFVGDDYQMTVFDYKQQKSYDFPIDDEVFNNISKGDTIQYLIKH